MTPIGTAIARGNGPFVGFVPEALTTLFELRQPGEDGEDHVTHVVVSNLPADDECGEETCVFATYEDGALDVDFYITNNGALIELAGDIPATDLIEGIGYEIVG